MKLRLLLTLGLVSLTASAQDVARMREVVQAQPTNRFMGAVLVAKDGAIVFEEGYGFANVEWQVPNTPTTKFRLGSLTKQFTAAAILLLEERGKLAVDDPVSKYLPEAPPAWAKVTLRHLLSHTSGVPNFTSFPEYETWKYLPLTPAQTLDHLRSHPLDFTPGEKFQYSNSNYILLGLVVERASGIPYADFLQQNIFGPLGMADTGYDSNTAVIAHRAAGYVPAAAGLANASYINMHVPGGAGGLYSTVEDLLRWTQGLFGGKLLTAASLTKMTTPGLGSYGFGVFNHDAGGRTVIDHGGGIDGFNTNLAYYPASKVTVVVLANVNGMAPGAVAAELAALAFGEKVTLPSDRKEVAVPAAVLQSYVGIYRLNPQVTNTIRFVDGHLTTQLTGQGPLRIYPESETRFFLKVVDAQLAFVRDPKGQITELVLYQHGRTQKAVRVSDQIPEHKAITLPADKLAAYAGTYQLTPAFALTVTIDGDQLSCQATGQARAQIFPETETRFFYKIVEAQIEFVRDSKGLVTGLILHQNGRDLPGQRLP